MPREKSSKKARPAKKSKPRSTAPRSAASASREQARLAKKTEKARLARVKDDIAISADENDPVIDQPDPDHGPVLVIDIGGSSFKMIVSGQITPRSSETGKDFTPVDFVNRVKELTEDWEYDCITIGFPGPVGHAGPYTEPGNLGDGWIGFNFVEAFGKPVKILNDAVMQALGSYEGGRMLFMGLGTGVGAAFIGPQMILPIELGNLRYNKKYRLGEVLGTAGLERLGKKKWREIVNSTAKDLIKVFLADHVVIGGGNARILEELSHGLRKGHNHAAFRGGVRAWAMAGASVQTVDRVDLQEPGWHIV